MGSRLVLGASTLALVMVASGGTAILVTQGANQLQRSPMALPPVVEFPKARPRPTPLVVPPSPGSALFPSRPAAGPVAPVPAGPQAVQVPVVEPPVVQPPVVVPPVAPPVVEPPVVEPPVVEPPVVEPPSVDEPGMERPTKGTKGKNPHARGTKPGKGHSWGQSKRWKR